jgi:uncharacterized protein YoxC
LNETLDNVCKSLDELALLILKAYTDDRTLKEIWGWNNPAITRHDLSAMSSSLANRIRKANLDTLDDELEAMLNDIPRRLKSLHTDTIPHIFNGNAIQAVPAYIQTINWLSTALDPLLGWESLQDSKAMPAALARRLRAIQAELENIVHNKELLKEQIRLIQDATEAAESLPTDLQSLKEARKAINKLSTDSAKLYGKIDEKYGNATSSVKQIIEKEDEAKNLVEKCEDAYRITTTKGLAAAFDHRAHRLSESMWLWVLGLLCALVVGAYLGSDRIALLTNAVSEKEPHWSVIWMHLTLSLLSIGAPLWFAWLATKQIGQRFRLAEDYGYKASVAKAYEGYRKEAVISPPRSGGLDGC